MRVVVIGAGAIGAVAALRLRAAGVEVVLVAQMPPEGTLSAHSFGWANGIDEGSDAYYALSLEALASHCRLAVETGPEWLGQKGNLHWAVDAEGETALAATADGYRELGYPVCDLLAEDVLRDLEPGLRLEGLAGTVRFYPDDVHIHGELMLEAVCRQARELGVVERFGERVAEVLPGGTGVRLDGGEVLGADAVVCCAGRGNVELLSGLGVELPLLPPGSPKRLTRGVLVRTTPVPRPVTRVVHAPGLSIRPAADGGLVLHCHDLDWTLTENTDPSSVAEEILDRLPGVLPSAGGAKIASVFKAVRPVPADGRTIVGPVPGAGAVSVVATHSGVTLAAVLGEVVAAEVTGAPHPLAASFRLGRFADG